MLHIIWKFILHFMVCGNLLMFVYFFVSWQARKHPKFKHFLDNFLAMFDRKMARLIFCAILIAWIVPFRELYDIAMDNNGLGKAVTDTISWWLGAGTAVWGFYRFKND